MSNIYNNMAKEESSKKNLSSFNTLERELSIRYDHPVTEGYREMSIQSNHLHNEIYKPKQSSLSNYIVNENNYLIDLIILIILIECYHLDQRHQTQVQ